MKEKPAKLSLPPPRIRQRPRSARGRITRHLLVATCRRRSPREPPHWLASHASARKRGGSVQAEWRSTLPRRTTLLASPSRAGRRRLPARPAWSSRARAAGARVATTVLMIARRSLAGGNDFQSASWLAPGGRPARLHTRWRRRPPPDAGAIVDHSPGLAVVTRGSVLPLRDDRRVPSRARHSALRGARAGGRPGRRARAGESHGCSSTGTRTHEFST